MANSPNHDDQHPDHHSDFDYDHDAQQNSPNLLHQQASPVFSPKAFDAAFSQLTQADSQTPNFIPNPNLKPQRTTPSRSWTWPEDFEKEIFGALDKLYKSYKDGTEQEEVEAEADAKPSIELVPPLLAETDKDDQQSIEAHIELEAETDAKTTTEPSHPVAETDGDDQASIIANLREREFHNDANSDDEGDVNSIDTINWTDDENTNLPESDEEVNEVNGGMYTEIVDEGDGLSEYDSEEDAAEFVLSDEEQVDTVAQMQRDLRGRLVIRPQYGDIDIKTGQVFETVHEFRCVIKDYAIQERNRNMMEESWKDEYEDAKIFKKKKKKPHERLAHRRSFAASHCDQVINLRLELI
ncbi:hypothetical protein OWV82_006661 [Melia azedarach]|uniref:Uncharacterized protein n=1 Tax=Melia azedarach TaxID=155640 RepID=A0ACC1YJE8_MELAZ|nr:hypothetical protein OWV82_006661 [Melia azedarach]